MNTALQFATFLKMGGLVHPYGGPTGENVNRASATSLAQLHLQCLPDSVPAIFGEAYLRHFYRFLQHSPSELIYNEVVDGKVLGACVVSLDYRSAYSRLMRATFGSLLKSTVIQFATNHAVRMTVLKLARQLLVGKPLKSTQSSDPTILYIFTDAAARGQGIGKKLLSQVDADLKSRGYNALRVRTEKENNAPTISFYERNFFVPFAEETELGRRFCLFSKRILNSQFPESLQYPTNKLLTNAGDQDLTHPPSL